MSDYLYSSSRQATGFLTNCLKAISETLPGRVTEFHGTWGSLAVRHGPFLGFQPFETDDHILVVIGGPVLYFRNNDFLTGVDSAVATRSIYQRWRIEKAIRWDEDLSGPFTVILVDKRSHRIEVVTDLMSFLPVYCFRKGGQFTLGTHIDALALASECTGCFDPVSLTDFVVNGVITYPYTAYQNIRQLPPSSTIEFPSASGEPRHQAYWLPEETSCSCLIQEAAETLRNGLEDYVRRVTSSMSRVAQFLSGGEDSRVIAGMLPEHLERDAFLFLDDMNREGRIAQRVAHTYKTKLTVGFRSRTYYLEILPKASRLVGSGCRYVHAHSLGFDREFSLGSYDAVFGGFASDTLLKGYYLPKPKVTGRLPFVPQVESKLSPPFSKPPHVWRDCFETFEEVQARQSQRFREVERLRPQSAKEWVHIYPYSMTQGIPNFYVTRRLFRSYEPFLSKEVVKTSACVSTAWKLNRRLFHLAMRKHLKPSRWIPHGNGYFPYWSFWINLPLHATFWLYFQTMKRLLGWNEGPWCDWAYVSRSPEWARMVEKLTDSLPSNGFLLNPHKAKQILGSKNFPFRARLNLLQTLYLTTAGVAPGSSTRLPDA